MSVFSSPRANPGIARILYKELSRRGATDRGRLMASIAPPQGYDARPGNALDETMDVCLDIGLFETQEGAIVIPAELALDGGAEVATFRALVRDLLFARAAHDPWDGNDGGRDLLRAVAWFLAQDPLRPLSDWATAEGLLDRQLGFEERVIRNEEQWRSFQRWATFLGFAARFAGTGRARMADLVVPVPTTAVADSLHSPGTSTAREFIDAIGHLLPVLDGGAVRAEMDRRIQDTSRAEGTVSASLSVCILQLEAAGRLILENPADALSSSRVVLRAGRDSRTVAYISLEVA